jgi:hypothetical protein
VEGSFEYGNDPSGSIKSLYTLEYMNDGGFRRKAQPHGVSKLVKLKEIDHL